MNFVERLEAQVAARAASKEAADRAKVQRAARIARNGLPDLRKQQDDPLFATMPPELQAQHRAVIEGLEAIAAMLDESDA